MAGQKNSKYKPEYDTLAFNYCSLGADDVKLGELFNVTKTTINNWKNDHPTFFDSLKRGKGAHDSIRVEDSLLKRALGYEWTEEKQEDGTNGSKTTTVNKHVPGDATSMIFWLKNRDPNRWREKQEISHVLSDNFEDLLGDANDD